MVCPYKSDAKTFLVQAYALTFMSILDIVLESRNKNEIIFNCIIEEKNNCYGIAIMRVIVRVSSKF